jgi:arylsulfatase A-like enzyme
MNRIAALLFACLAQTFACLAAPERPNILFIFADDWGRYASAWAALESRPSPNQVIKTPHIDRIAREGVFFRNTFVPAPSCTPCRSSLLTGRYFFNTNRAAILEGAQWDDSIPAWPLLLRDAGYHIGKSFKVWSPGTPADAPFGGQQYAFQKAGGALNNFSENVTRLVKEGVPLDEARQRMLGQVRGNFDAFLAAREASKPWCYWFGPTTTHRTWIKGSGKALWGIEPEALKGKLPKFLPDVPEVREDVADYLGEVQALDAYVGVLLDQLAASGELERTIVIVSGDHGMPGVPGGKCNLYDFGTGVTLAARMPGGKGGRVVDDFVNLMDLAPTLLEAAGVAAPPGLNSRSFLNVLKSDRSGQVDPGRTSVITGRERHVGAAREGNLPYPMRALRTADFLYIRNFAPDRWPMGAPGAITETSAAELETNTRAGFADMDAGPTKAWLIAHRDDPQWKWHYDFAFAKRPADELYDLRKDPEQTINVAAEPAYEAEKAKLAAQLMKTLADAGDPRVTGDGQTFDRAPFSDAPAQSLKRPARKAAAPDVAR